MRSRSVCDLPRSSTEVLLQLKKGGVAKTKGEGEKEKGCTTECKSRRRRDEKALWVLNYESGEGVASSRVRGKIIWGFLEASFSELN